MKTHAQGAPSKEQSILQQSLHLPQAHQKAVAEVEQKLKDLGNATTALEAASTALQLAKNPPRTRTSASGFDDGDRRPTGSNRKDVNAATASYNAALAVFTSASQAALNSKLDLLASDYKEQVAAINARGERAKVPHAAALLTPKAPGNRDTGHHWRSSGETGCSSTVANASLSGRALSDVMSAEKLFGLVARRSPKRHGVAIRSPSVTRLVLRFLTLLVALLGLRCTGDKIGPSLATLSTSPQELDFGSVVQNESATRMITLEAAGARALNVSAVSVDSSVVAPAFSVQPLGSFEIGAGQTRVVEVTFRPMRAGAFSASLRIETDSRQTPVLLVPLVGVGTNGDAGLPIDAGASSADAGSSMIDAGTSRSDAGSTDAGSTDAGSADAGSTDASSTDAGGPPVDAGGPRWLDISPAAGPVGQDSVAAYDIARGKTVLFGGLDSSNAPLNTTWEWDGTSWTSKPTPPALTARSGSCAAYDPKNARVVIFGGGRSSTTNAETWAFDGTTWSQISVASSPPARQRCTMTYDSVRQRLVLFGGYSSSTFFDDTWEFDGAVWSAKSPAASPEARGFASMAFDEMNGKTLLFGGIGPNGLKAPGTWLWDGSNWEKVTPTTEPSLRFLHTSAYDSERHQVLVFGGSSTNGEPTQSDTWAWTGTNWSAVTTSAIPARTGHSMAFDRARNRMVVFGGHHLAFEFRDETYELAGATWNRTLPLRPPYRLRACGAFDSARQRMVLYGGSAGNGFPQTDLWEYDGHTWTMPSLSAAPPIRYSCTMAFDSSRGTLVMFGGAQSPYRADTWTWDGSAWANVTPAQPSDSPSAREGHVMGYDANLGRIVLFGGVGQTGLLNDTWSWNGTLWQQHSPAAAPSARAFAGFGADPVRMRLVLMGGRSPSSALGETWEWTGNTWEPKAADPQPTARYSASLAYDANLNRLVLYGGFTPGVSRDTWLYDGTAWAQRPTRASPPYAAFALTYTDPATGRATMVDIGGMTWQLVDR